MAKQNVYLIIDGSGSMAGVKHEVVKGINDFIDEQQNEAQTTGDDILFSLTAFDDHVREVVIGEDINLVNHVNTKDTFFGGGTALYDAIGKTLTTAKNDKKESNIVVIYTDGEENSSSEFTAEQIEKLIKKLQKGGWAFIYLGAEFADFRKDQAVMAMSSTINTGKQTAKQTFSRVSQGASYYRGLTSEERVGVANAAGGLVSATMDAGIVDWEEDPLTKIVAPTDKDNKSKTDL